MSRATGYRPVATWLLLLQYLQVNFKCNIKIDIPSDFDKETFIHSEYLLSLRVQFYKAVEILF